MFDKVNSENLTLLVRALNDYGYRGPDGRNLEPYDLQAMTIVASIVTAKPKFHTGGVVTVKNSSSLGTANFNEELLLPKNEAEFLVKNLHRVSFKWLPRDEFMSDPRLRMAMPRSLMESLSKEIIRSHASATAFASKMSLDFTTESVFASADTVYLTWKSAPLPAKETKKNV